MKDRFLRWVFGITCVPAGLLFTSLPLSYIGIAPINAIGAGIAIGFAAGYSFAHRIVTLLGAD